MRRTIPTQVIALACALTILAAGCRTDSPGPTADYKPKLEILELLESGSLVQVEELLDEARESVREGGAGDRLLMQRLQAFSSSDPELGRLLREWVETQPESALAHLALGLHLRHIGFKFRSGELIRHMNEHEMAAYTDFASQAAVHYLEAARLDPRNPLVWGFLANLPASSRPIDIDWDTVLEQHAPLSESVWYMALFKAKPKWGGSIFRLQDLLQRLEERIEANPELAALRGFDQHAIADRHFWNGHYGATMTSCQRAIDMGGLAKYREICSFALRELGRLDEALAMIDRAIEDSPEEVNYLAERARVLEAMQRWEEAAATMHKVLRYRPYDPGMLRQTSFYLEKINRLDEAFELLARAMHFGEFDDRTHDSLAGLHYIARNYAESAESARRSLELSRNKSWPYMRLANAYGGLVDCGNMHRALNDFLRSCKALNDCSQENLDWAHDTLETIATHSVCEEWRNESRSDPTKP